MLEQAIIDAAALREAALKNAEQSLIEKYAPQIKEAVKTMLEDTPTTMKYEGRIVSIVHEADDDGNVTVSEAGGKPFMVKEADLEHASADDLLNEEEADMATDAGGEGDLTNIVAPLASDPGVSEDEPVTLDLRIDDIEGDITIDLGELEDQMAKDDTPMPEDDMFSIGDDIAPEVEAEEDLLGGLDLGGEEDEEQEDAEQPLQELLDLLEEYETDVIEEKITVDMSHQKDGTFQTNEATLEYEELKQEAHDAHDEEDEEEEEDETSKLQETIELLMTQNEKLESIVYKLNDKLEETLLSNAKLLYQNRTLNDASLNERQKSKIVEAIANAESPKEAKQLHETLRTTVGSDNKKGPQSLSETVNRRSNLSGMLNRGQNLNERKNSDDSFIEKMQKLAGIK